MTVRRLFAGGTTCLISAWPVVPTACMHHHLFGVVLDVIALELDELVEAEFAQRLSLARVLPADPREILHNSVRFRGQDDSELTGAG